MIIVAFIAFWLGVYVGYMTGAEQLKIIKKEKRMTKNEKSKGRSIKEKK